MGAPQVEELRDVHNVALPQAQLPLQHLPVPVDAFLGERVRIQGLQSGYCVQPLRLLAPFSSFDLCAIATRRWEN